MKRFVVNASLALLIALCAYVLTVLWKSHAEFQVAEGLFNRGLELQRFWDESEGDLLAALVGPKAKSTGNAMARDLRYDSWSEALLHLKRALDWNIYNSRAAELLMRMDAAARTDGNPDFSLRVLRDYRAALYAARSLFQPKKRLISTLDAEIMLLVQGTAKQEAQWNHEFSQPSLPPTTWTSLTSAIFLLWCISVMLLIKYGFDASGAIRQGASAARAAPLYKSSFVVLLMVSVSLWMLWFYFLSRVG